MNRKQFIFSTAGLAITVYVNPIWGMAAESTQRLDRIAIGTVLFRYRFEQTKPEDVIPKNSALTLVDVPAYYKQRFGVKNIEFWSEHFKSLDKEYLQTLKTSIQKSKSTLLNVQVDVPYDLASKNENTRQEGLQLVKSWMDAAAFLGSKCIRINPGRADGDMPTSIKSMKEVNTYAKSKKLILLSENHFGIEMNVKNHLEILDQTGENHYALPDFGNYPVETMFDALNQILPHAYMISAKVMDFDTNFNHISYDYAKCVQMAEKLGFKGIYCLEQWSPNTQNLDYEKVTDWLIKETLANMKSKK